MHRETETHNFSSHPTAAEFWNNNASYWASSNCKRVYVPKTWRRVNSVDFFLKHTYIKLKEKYTINTIKSGYAQNGIDFHINSI